MLAVHSIVISWLGLVQLFWIVLKASRVLCFFLALDSETKVSAWNPWKARPWAAVLGPRDVEAGRGLGRLAATGVLANIKNSRSNDASRWLGSLSVLLILCRYGGWVTVWDGSIVCLAKQRRGAISLRKLCCSTVPWRNGLGRVWVPSFATHTQVARGFVRLWSQRMTQRKARHFSLCLQRAQKKFNMTLVACDMCPSPVQAMDCFPVRGVGPWFRCTQPAWNGRGKMQLCTTSVKSMGGIWHMKEEIHAVLQIWMFSEWSLKFSL